jgi:iron complex outermembrane recepter protein
MVRETFSVITLVLLSGTAMPLFAQTAPAQDNATLPEIVVTAQKRTENIINVPISITVLSNEQLLQSARRTVNDLQYAVPNLTTYSNTDFSPNIVIRGFESSARNIGFESSLGVYIDGVFTGRTQSFTQELDDVARLEVLRGPQGTLFGKNTTTGAINITTERPGKDLHANLRAEGGNYGYYRGSASVSGPLLTDVVAAKLSGFVTGHNGYVRNVAPGAPARLQNDKSYGMRGEIRITQGDSLDIAIRGDYSHRNSTSSQNEISATLENPFDLPVNNVIPGPRTVSQNIADVGTRDLYGGSVTVNYTLGNNGVLTSISALRGIKATSNGDVDSTPLKILGFNSREKLSQFSQEVRYASSDADAFKYVVGLYYFSQNAKQKRAFTLEQDLVDIFVNGFGLPPEFLVPAAVSPDAAIDTKSYAAFANASYDITDALTLNAGLRYSRETKKLTLSQSAPPALSASFLDFPATKDSLKSSDLSPTVGLSYKLGERMNTYLRYSKGFKSGGWNTELVPASVAILNTAGDVTGYNLGLVKFKPESIENYEFGFKSELLDRKVRFNLAVFLQDFKNIQLLQFVGGVQGFSVGNAPKARSTGFEAELAARPTRNFELSASLGYANSRYRSYKNADANGTDLTGRRLDTPKWTATLGAQYTYPVSENVAVVIGGDYAYRSSRPGDPFEPNSALKAFGLLDGRLGVEFGERWNVYLWSKNIFAKDYLISRYTDTSSALVGLSQQNESYGDPRTFGVRAGLKF